MCVTVGPFSAPLSGRFPIERSPRFCIFRGLQKGIPLSKIFLLALTVAALGHLPARAQAYPGTQPVNRAASGAYSLRNLALGELRFTNAQLYNLYDQGGSPMGLLETHPERMSATLGLLGNDRATSGDSLTI